MLEKLADPHKNVRQATLQVVSLAARKTVFADTVKAIISKIMRIFDLDEESDVRVDALKTFSDIVHIQGAPLKDTIRAIPIIAKLFKDGTNAVRVAAFETCSDIATVHRATLQTAVNNIMPKILPTVDSSSDWQTQIAALKTLSTLAEIDGLCETLNDNALDTIFAGLSNDDCDVRVQVLDTLKVLASQVRLHNGFPTIVLGRRKGKVVEKKSKKEIMQEFQRT
ncbi:armadillo-type protein [Mycena sanguinolenta]|nr:armadillo-type protein [Mycena sanguinolenta]